MPTVPVSRLPAWRLTPRGRFIVLGVAGSLAVVVAVAAATRSTPAKTPAKTSAKTPRTELHQIVTWAASPLPDRTGLRFTDQTFRDVVYTSAGGRNLRIRLSNARGRHPVAFTDVRVGRQRAGAAIVPGTNHALTFGGRRSVTIYPGTEVYSDPLPDDLPPAQHLVVSIYLPGASGPTTNHWSTEQTTYVSTRGDHAADEGAAAYPVAGANTVWWYLDGITVEAPAPVGTVVALGDSITDGYRSTRDADHRYPDFLAARLRHQPAPDRLGVINEGISGEQVTSGMLSRLDRDVLAQPDVASVIYMCGINDIGSNHTADQLIAADRQIIDRVHARGIRILGGTLTPFAGSITYNAMRERTRQSLNRWIRASGAFDGVVDFDRALRDPADPSELRAAYDSGDHIHPSDAGYAAMAAAVDLRALR